MEVLLGWTEVHQEVYGGRAEAVQKLIDDGADVNVPDKDGKTPMDVCEEHCKDADKKAAVLEVLRKHSARHSLLFAAEKGLTDVVKQLLAAGAKAESTDQRGMTALMLACAKGQQDTAEMLVAPTHAAAALDVRSTAGYTALMWAEERALTTVVQMLRACGAAVVSRPPLALWRGEWKKVQIDVTERKVTFSNRSDSTLRSRQQCPLGGKGYYELEILVPDRQVPQYGFASPAFERVLGASNKRVGDDSLSWAVDGENKHTKHKGERGEYKCDKWKEGDVIGLACDLDKMEMLVSLNGSYEAPHGCIFTLAPDAVGDGLFAAFSGRQGKVRYNLGETPFKHAAPSADYVTFSAFDTDT